MMTFAQMLMAPVSPLFPPEARASAKERRPYVQTEDTRRRIEAADERYRLAFAAFGSRGATVKDLTVALGNGIKVVHNRLHDLETRGKVVRSGIIRRQGGCAVVWKWRRT